MALMGNDERVSADTALRSAWSPRWWRRRPVEPRAHEIAATIAAKPPSATQGTVKAIWESLDKPYRAALDHGLPIYTRLGNPLGKGRTEASADGRAPHRGSGDVASSQRASRTCSDWIPPRRRCSSTVRG